MKKLIITFLFIFFPLPILADAMTLSVSPPLIKNNVNPGQLWKSSIKVVNNNPEDIEVYVKVLDFESGSNSGTVKFLPELSEQEKKDRVKLSSWFIIDTAPIIIPAFKSQEVSFIIEVPESVEPGGHYAAILVGTTPPEKTEGGSNVKVSSMLSSLIFLNVEGDVLEKGHIREFSTDRDFYFDPKVNFKVRFENLGNVHIQPRGELRIFDFFGKNKETINLNHNSEFGNVLPKDIRSWNFSWEGEGSLLEMGKYKAELILSYGNKAKETIDQTLYFWVIYPKPLAITVGSVLGILLLLFFTIRGYIRRSIKAVQQASGVVEQEGAREVRAQPNRVQRPVMAKTQEKKVVDLRASKNEVIMDDNGMGWSGFKKFAIFLLILLVVILSMIFYLKYYNNFSNDEKVIPVKQEDTVEEGLQVVSEDLPIDEEKELLKKEDEEKEKKIIAEELADEEVVEETKDKEDLIIKVLNGSGIAGVAAEVVDTVEQKDFVVSQIGNADNFNYEVSEIRYRENYLKHAEEIKSILDRKAVVKKVSEQEDDIVVIIGKSLK